MCAKFKDLAADQGRGSNTQQALLGGTKKCLRGEVPLHSRPSREGSHHSERRIRQGTSWGKRRKRKGAYVSSWGHSASRQSVWVRVPKGRRVWGLSQPKSVLSMVGRCWVQFHRVYKGGRLHMSTIYIRHICLHYTYMLIWATFKAIGHGKMWIWCQLTIS